MDGLTEHEKSLWNQMVVLCDQFLDRRLGLASLVNGLEGLLDAGDFRDKELRERWYSLWLPLEIRNASGKVERSPEANEEVKALRAYLDERLKLPSPPRS